jgi:nucleotide-binding universal stress UspA family protein
LGELRPDLIGVIHSERVLRGHAAPLRTVIAIAGIEALLGRDGRSGSTGIPDRATRALERDPVRRTGRRDHRRRRRGDPRAAGDTHGALLDKSDVNRRRHDLDEAQASLGADGFEADSLGQGRGAVIVGAPKDRGANLIVVCHRGQRALERLSVGPVSAKVVRRAPCDCSWPAERRGPRAGRGLRSRHAGPDRPRRADTATGLFVLDHRYRPPREGPSTGTAARPLTSCAWMTYE